MKMKAIQSYSPKFKAGDLIEITGMKADRNFAGNIKVAVSGIWDRPKWLAITYFIEYEKIKP